jgi:hypothetical protein
VRKRQRGQENGELTTDMRRCRPARDINQTRHVNTLEDISIQRIQEVVFKAESLQYEDILSQVRNAFASNYFILSFFPPPGPVQLRSVPRRKSRLTNLVLQVVDNSILTAQSNEIRRYKNQSKLRTYSLRLVSYFLRFLFEPVGRADLQFLSVNCPEVIEIEPTRSFGGTIKDCKTCLICSMAISIGQSLIR